MTPLLSAPLADDAPHLLVVDDDRRIRDLLSRYLRAEGYRVTTADTAADARAKLDGLSFDLLDSRRHHARRNRLRIREIAAHALQRADPDADRAGGKGEPHRRPGDRRRRLRGQALRAARIVAADRQYPQAAAAGAAARAGRDGAVRPVPVSPRARRAAARRRDGASHRPREGHAATAGGGARRDGAAPRPHRQRRAPPASARSTCRSTGCAARSRTIPPIRCSCRPCAASAIGWWCSRDQPRPSACRGCAWRRGGSMAAGSASTARSRACCPRDSMRARSSSSSRRW